MYLKDLFYYTVAAATLNISPFLAGCLAIHYFIKQCNTDKKNIGINSLILASFILHGPMTLTFIVVFACKMYNNRETAKDDFNKVLESIKAVIKIGSTVKTLDETASLAVNLANTLFVKPIKEGVQALSIESTYNKFAEECQAVQTIANSEGELTFAEIQEALVNRNSIPL